MFAHCGDYVFSKLLPFSYKEDPSNTKLQRIEQSVQNILDLQEHLRAYLQNHSLQKTQIDLKTLMEQQIVLVEKNYPHIDFICELDTIMLHTNQDALSRILINILTNAAKYNKQNGWDPKARIKVE